MDSDSPHIFRPIPRRPFDRSGAVREPTPPASDGGGEDYSTPSRRASGLTPDDATSATGDPSSANISRAASFLNLQKSTLFGIYQSSSQGPDSPSVDKVGDGLGNPGSGSPWGSGAETPLVRRPGVSDAMFEIMRSRRNGDASQRMDAEFDPGHSSGALAQQQTTPVWDAVSVLFRVAVLFGLGVGYGTLMGKLGISRSAAGGGAGADGKDGSYGYGISSIAADAVERPDWGHSLFWGFGGVAIALLLPWLDGVWEAKFGPGAGARGGIRGGGPKPRRKSSTSDEARPPMDWTLVLRPIAAFLGIVFAIRKLAWTSTMQVSLYLAAVNPFLWYLIDRSKTGFLLSAAFSITSSAVLMGVDPDLMPVPSVAMSPLRNATRAAAHGPGGRGGRGYASWSSSSSWSMPSDEAVERALWIASVLFCSCLVFGNIGRRMGLERSAYTRGRWAGVR